MTERFNIEFDGHRYFLVIDTDNERCLARLDTRLDASAWLEIYEILSDENEQLKKDVEYWKQVASQYSNELNVLGHYKKNKIRKRDYTSMGLYDGKTEKENGELGELTEKRFRLTTTEFDGTLSFYDAEYDCETRMGTEYVLDKVEITLNALNQALKRSLYAEKTNTVEVINDYAKQFKRHSKEFSFMIDLAEDLGVNVRKLEALDD